MKQDMSGARTAQDLERKYDLRSIGTLKRNYELQKEQLNKVENEITDFAKATTKEIDDLKNQVDGNITTWFSSGLPTLENYPANEWLTNDEMNNHLGDLYYDQDTGYSYRFIQKDGVYEWIKITDSDVAEALAIANAAKDTADRKRQVFIVDPLPPYDVGDLWINDEEIYRCQTSKGSGENFENNDWIKATKYTDDTVANQVGENLTILSGTVAEVIKNVDSLDTTITNTNQLVNEQGEQIGILSSDSTKISQTVNEITLSVTDIRNNSYTKDEVDTKLTDGSVQKVTTTSGTFDKDGLTIEKTNAKTKGNFNEKGVVVKDATGSEEKELLFAGYDEELGAAIVRTEHIRIGKYLNVGTHSRIEDYEDGGGIFYIG